jgi:hypothetical protein
VSLPSSMDPFGSLVTCGIFADGKPIPDTLAVTLVETWTGIGMIPRAHMVALHFLYYNFARVHKTLRVTPAMEAGLSNHIWTMEEMVSLLEPKSISGWSEADGMKSTLYYPLINEAQK